MPLSIYSTSEIRQIERFATSRPAPPPLMARAGRAAAALAQSLAPDDGAPILILAGPGNNGGDAFVAARHLAAEWRRVDVVFPGSPERLPPDAKAAHGAWLDAGGRCHAELPLGRRWGLAVDGLFGIGLQRPLDGVYATLVAHVNRLGIPILALDIPSGLHGDTGCAMGETIRASDTLTFIAHKPGLWTGDGPDHCGRIHLDTLGIECPPPGASGRLLDRELVTRALHPRPRNSHKALFGSVGIVGGAGGMRGAALLAGRAALKLGAGRVYLGLLEPGADLLDPQQAELMLRPQESVFEIPALTSLVVGPGLGRSPQARQVLARALETNLPLVVDADGLNLLAQDLPLQQTVYRREAPTLLTPHAAEAARLLDTTARMIQQDRIGSATMLAERLQCGVVLKGCGSLCVEPAGTWAINPTGNPGLASAGTGDVLSGILGALLAQGLSARDAMWLAVYLHGAAADDLVAQGIGPIGLTASEVIDCARRLLNAWMCRQGDLA